ncbi:MAG: methionyl-tRNA formyltransferase, partial [Pirellula sp.]
MRLILMGTGPFAVPSFQAILADGHEVLHVVTRPCVAINNRISPASPVRCWATDSGLPIADPASVNDPATIAWLTSLHADLMVVCDYGQILSKTALEATRLGGINLHGSLLPRHRGAAPVQWSILSGDAMAGVSIIHMTPILDGGPVLHQASTQIEPTEDALQLEARLSQLGVNSTLVSLRILAGKETLDDCHGLGVTQDKSLTTKAPRLAKEDGELDMRFQVRHLDRLVRALQPWPGTFAHMHFPDGKSMRVIIPKVHPIETATPTDLEPGDFLFGQALQNASVDQPKLNDALLA